MSQQMCRSCGERPAEAGPYCARCADLKMGLDTPTEEEAERLGLALPTREDGESAVVGLTRQSSVGPVERKWPSHIELARASRKEGRTFLQITLPLSDTRRTVVGILAGSKALTTDYFTEAPQILQDIEGEGWRLEHASYIFQETGSVSREKFYSSGQTGSTTGTIVGVYLFRVAPLDGDSSP